MKETGTYNLGSELGQILADFENNHSKEIAVDRMITLIEGERQIEKDKIVKGIDNYFKGLVIILDSQATKKSLIDIIIIN